MIYDKNRVNNEIDNIDCDEDEDIKRYTSKYINIVNDKLILINAASELIDDLMEGLDVDTSNDIAAKKIKDFKRVIIKSIDKFNSFIKLDIKKKDIKKKGIEKRDTEKNSIDHDAKNNKPDNGLATSADIKAHIIDKQKLIKQRYKSLLETKKTIKNNIELINSACIKKIT